MEKPGQKTCKKIATPTDRKRMIKYRQEIYKTYTQETVYAFNTYRRG